MCSVGRCDVAEVLAREGAVGDLLGYPRLPHAGCGCGSSGGAPRALTTVRDHAGTVPAGGWGRDALRREVYAAEAWCREALAARGGGRGADAGGR